MRGRRKHTRRRPARQAVGRTRPFGKLLLEPLEDRRLLAVAEFDFGDAPAPYATMLADDGPRHELIGPMLGMSADAEDDGQPSTDADGDGSDEDGVAFGSIRVGQLDASVTVNVQHAPVGAKLDAWIDFNGDGSWGGPGEQIFASAPVINGDNALQFDVPSWAAFGDAYARFRLSTAGDLGPGGLAADGEVEDYLIAIDPPAPASGVFGGQNTISANLVGVKSVIAADVDGDGDIDVISGSAFKIAWYENDGNAGFTAHTISTDVNFIQNVFAADVDGDGDIDVLSASKFSVTNQELIVWYENDGSGRFKAHDISSRLDRAAGLFAADMDGDGDIDVITTETRFGSIPWYENDGSGRFTRRTMRAGSGGFPFSVFAVDMDRDGDMDVLTAPARNGTIVWHENDGHQTFRQRTTTGINAYNALAADMDGDGDVDIFGTGRDLQIAWLENDGTERFTARDIDIMVRSNLYRYAVDIDGDGDFDVLTTSEEDRWIAWYENDGSGGFTAHTISATEGARTLFAADVDGDGDIDVLSASYDDGTIAWYENLSPIPGPVADLTGNGFVDFEDLTVLLAHWNQNVSAAEGNLVEPLITVVNFEDLAVLLAAWTGPGPVASPEPAAVAATTESRTTTTAHFDRIGRRDDVALQRRVRRNEVPISSVSPLRRLQAAAVDRALAEESIPDRERMFRRRAGSSAHL